MPAIVKDQGAVPSTSHLCFHFPTDHLQEDIFTTKVTVHFMSPCANYTSKPLYPLVFYCLNNMRWHVYHEHPHHVECQTASQCRVHVLWKTVMYGGSGENTECLRQEWECIQVMLLCVFSVSSFVSFPFLSSVSLFNFCLLFFSLLFSRSLCLPSFPCFFVCLFLSFFHSFCLHTFLFPSVIFHLYC